MKMIDFQFFQHWTGNDVPGRYVPMFYDSKEYCITDHYLMEELFVDHRLLWTKV